MKEKKNPKISIKEKKPKDKHKVSLPRNYKSCAEGKLKNSPWLKRMKTRNNKLRSKAYPNKPCKIYFGIKIKEISDSDILTYFVLGFACFL